MIRHQVDDGLTGQADEGFVDQEARARMPAQQVRQGRHVENPAIGIVGIDDDGEGGALRDDQFPQIEGKVLVRRQPCLGVVPGNFREQHVGRRQQMDLLAKAVEQLAQDQFGAGIDVDQPLGHPQPLAQQLAQRRRIGLGVVVAVRHFGLRRGDRFLDRRQGIFTQQQLDSTEPAAAFFRDGCHACSPIYASPSWRNLR
jgi:hypothetical protein